MINSAFRGSKPQTWDLWLGPWAGYDSAAHHLLVQDCSEYVPSEDPD